MRFTKMHGLGNDYIYIDTFEQSEPACGWAELSKRVCRRHFGVGGDGIILITPPTRADSLGGMKIYNPDGSVAEMCGNGLRCVAKYLHDRRGGRPDRLRVDTGAGQLEIRICARKKNGEAEGLEVDMGTPVLVAAAIPTLGCGGGEEEKLRVGEKDYAYTAVSMGNPHCVVFVEDLGRFPVAEIGPQIENMTGVFPNRANVEFVQVISPREVLQRTWERGAGETYACGTGASAVVVAGVLRGLLAEEVKVRLTGGDLDIRWPGRKHVVMTGPATYVCEGTLPEESCA
ncbi:MAG: diaminopimelate epimerase [Planctomycetes bacterium]|nr:diaminopimelate epimerase [Planctomycetota bacterium]